jgi:hypothetical protein
MTESGINRQIFVNVPPISKEIFIESHEGTNNDSVDSENNEVKT